MKYQKNIKGSFEHMVKKINPKSLTHLTRIVVKIVVLKGEENDEIMMEQNLFRWN